MVLRFEGRRSLALLCSQPLANKERQQYQQFLDIVLPDDNINSLARWYCHIGNGNLLVVLKEPSFLFEIFNIWIARVWEGQPGVCLLGWNRIAPGIIKGKSNPKAPLTIPSIVV
jgi:hypothetical protein